MVILESIALKLQKVQSVSILAILCKRRQEPFSKPKYCLKLQNWTIIRGIQFSDRK